MTKIPNYWNLFESPLRIKNKFSNLHLLSNHKLIFVFLYMPILKYIVYVLWRIAML